jgi:hypothetical protein
MADLLRAAGGFSERPQALLVGGYGGSLARRAAPAGPDA